MTTPVETCGSCRFDAAQYDVPDALGTLRAVPPMWQQLVDGVPEGALAARPAPEVWSAVEYAAHSADVAEAMGRLLHGIIEVDDVTLPGPPPAREPDVAGGAAAALARLRSNLPRLGRRARGLGGDDPRWLRTATIDGEVVDAGWVLRHAVHDLTHHLSDAGRGLHLLGAGAPTQEGSVVQLNVSGGGVPKRPVEVVEVGDRGLVGDRQADRSNHGRPLQALCLWSSEVIEALQAEGHPIHAGAAGENVTISGIDWASLRTGVQLLIGDVLAEVSAYATPCAKNAGWFLEGDFLRMLHDRHPGWSRIYAWVREPGTIRTGDRVVVEP
jgi:MOSC domain-containing protein YiiM